MGPFDEFEETVGDLLEKQRANIGYPVNLAYDYTKLLSSIPKMFELKMNNVGPVDESSNYAVNSKTVEKSVIEYFCELWKFDSKRVWGYVTSSGTEGNLQALYVAREIFPEAVLYYSKESHYSIKKIARILRLEAEEVDASASGEMDYDDLERKMSLRPGAPAIINANFGTTMKGAYDNARKIYGVVRKLGKEKEYYMHADGALMGFLLPLFKKDLFFKRYVHSISISGHKFLGVPFPCGVVMIDTSVRGSNGRAIDSVSNFVEYIDCADCTISGSRSGIAPLFLGYIISEKGTKVFEADAAKCVENAERLVHALNDLGMNAWRNDDSITVVFDRPRDEIVKKWQLASEGEISHVVVLPHVTFELILEFLEDLETNFMVTAKRK